MCNSFVKGAHFLKSSMVMILFFLWFREYVAGGYTATASIAGTRPVT